MKKWVISITVLAVLIFSCMTPSDYRRVNFRNGSFIYVPKDIPNFSGWRTIFSESVFKGKVIEIFGFTNQEPGNGRCVHILSVIENTVTYPLMVVYDEDCSVTDRDLKKSVIDYDYLKTGDPSGRMDYYRGDEINLNEFINLKEFGKLSEGGYYEHKDRS